MAARKVCVFVFQMAWRWNVVLFASFLLHIRGGVFNIN